MMGITHTTNTTALLSIPLLFGYQLNTSYIVLGGLVLIGSLVPDIDEPDSYMGKRFVFLSYPLNILFGHRTITHNMTFIFILAIISYYYNNIYCLAVTVGMFIHILQDSLTYQGIKGCLFPFKSYNYNFVLLPRIFRFAVGSGTELLILAFSLMFILYVVYKSMF